MGEELNYQYYSSVQMQDVEWLWYPYIPFGKITIVQGDPGEGKSTFVLNIMALVTKGENMPDGYPSNGALTAIYQCSEDDVADTIKPRLVTAGADCSRVAYIEEKQQNLTLDDERIEKIIMCTGARLLVLDPIQSFLAQDGDMQSAGRMRAMLRKISDIAARHRCAVILVGHLNKANGGKQLYRGLGTIDIAATARSILFITRSKSDPQIRYMKPVKSSLAPEGTGIAFSFVDGKLEWREDIDIQDLEFEQIAQVESGRTPIVRQLRTLLSDRDYVSTEILDILANTGVPRRTAFRAKQDAGVETYRVGTKWFWHLPRSTEQEVIVDRGDE